MPPFGSCCPLTKGQWGPSMATMRARIPPSLKWLADRRARLAGEIKRLEDRFARFAEENCAVENSLQVCREDLRALDRIITTHEIAVNPERIPSIKLQTRVLPFARGQATRLVFSYLKLRRNQWSTTTEIASYLWVKSNASGAVLPEFRLAVRHRLKHLAQADRIERTKPRAGQTEAYWRAIQSSAGI